MRPTRAGNYKNITETKLNGKGPRIPQLKCLPKSIKHLVKERGPVIFRTKDYWGKHNKVTSFENKSLKGKLISAYVGQINQKTSLKEGKGRYLFPNTQEAENNYSSLLSTSPLNRRLSASLQNIPQTTPTQSFCYYEGYFKNNKFHGEGVLYQGTDRVLKGTWTYGYLQTSGKIIDNNSEFEYQGKLLNSIPNGYGTLKYKNGYTFKGNFINFIKNGRGLVTYSNGDSYSGSFRNNQKSGFGRQNWRSGESFEGTWKDGKMDGKGVYKWPNGTFYRGAYEKGKKCGLGEYVWPDGRRFEGYFKDGKMHGKGVYTNAKGELVAGVWEKGLKKSSLNPAEVDLRAIREEESSEQEDEHPSDFMEVERAKTRPVTRESRRPNKEMNQALSQYGEKERKEQGEKNKKIEDKLLITFRTQSKNQFQKMIDEFNDSDANNEHVRETSRESQKRPFRLKTTQISKKHQKTEKKRRPMIRTSQKSSQNYYFIPKLNLPKTKKVNMVTRSNPQHWKQKGANNSSPLIFGGSDYTVSPVKVTSFGFFSRQGSVFVGGSRDSSDRYRSLDSKNSFQVSVAARNIPNFIKEDIAENLLSSSRRGDSEASAPKLTSSSRKVENKLIKIPTRSFVSHNFSEELKNPFMGSCTPPCNKNGARRVIPIEPGINLAKNSPKHSVGSRLRSTYPSAPSLLKPTVPTLKSPLGKKQLIQPKKAKMGLSHVLKQSFRVRGNFFLNFESSKTLDTGPKFDPKNPDHQPFFFPNSKKYFTKVVFSKYLYIVKQFSILKVNLNTQRVVNEVDFRSRRTQKVPGRENEPPEPCCVVHSRANNDLVIFYQESPDMFYSVVSLDDKMARLPKKVLNFSGDSPDEQFLSELYIAGDYKMRFLPDSGVINHIYVLINKEEGKDHSDFESSQSSNQEEREEPSSEARPPILLAVDYRSGQCSILSSVFPIELSFVQYPVVFPSKDRVVVFRFDIQNLEWAAKLHKLSSGRELKEIKLEFNLDNLLANLIDVGSSTFYSIERVKTYLFGRSKFVVAFETDLLGMRMFPDQWEFDEQENSFILCLDFDNDKNLYKEVRNKIARQRNPCVGVFRKESIEAVVEAYHLQAHVLRGQNIILSFEEWQDLVVVRLNTKYDRLSGVVCSAEVSADAKTNTLSFLLIKKAASVMGLEQQVAKFRVGTDHHFLKELEVVMKFRRGSKKLVLIKEGNDMTPEKHKSEKVVGDDLVEPMVDRSMILWEDNQIVMRQEEKNKDRNQQNLILQNFDLANQFEELEKNLGLFEQ